MKDRKKTMKDRKRVRSFYSKLLKYTFPKGAVKMGVNSSVVRNTIESSLETMRKKGWNIHINLKDRRKTFNPIAYIDCGIDYRPRGGVSFTVNLTDIKHDTEVKYLSELLSSFQIEAMNVPERGEDIEYLHEEEEEEDAWR